jgi:hypothetical protein
MKGVVTAFLCGLLFAAGLVVSGMTVPDKVVGFLDLFGNWDPTLAFVMMGAIGTHLPLRRWLVSRGIADPAPPRNEINGRLLLGATLFGAGWGLSGFCPGPALVSAGTGAPSVLLFVAAMGVGMWAWQRMSA